MEQKGGWTIIVNEYGMTIDVLLDLYMSLCDSTTAKKINLTDLGKAIEKQLKNTYEISYDKLCYTTANIKNGLDYLPTKKYVRPVVKRVRVRIKLHQRIIYNINQKIGNEHFVDVRDANKLIGLYGKVNKIGGTEIYLKETFIPSIMKGLDKNTIPHEFGHSLGLYHVDEPWVWIKSMREQWNIQKMINNKTNIMYGGGGVYMNDKTSTTITPEQMNIIIENYKFGRLNLG